MSAFSAEKMFDWHDRIDPVELSIVIPVFNGSQTIGNVVEDIRTALAAATSFEIILVNDGSRDASEQVCSELVERYPQQVFLIQLARNFGEHNAVMAGLKHASGDYIAVLDDDGQNRADDVLRMVSHARENDLDVVFGRYSNRKHPRLRILGSWFNDRVACLLLKKPRDLYLSSFKVMSRLVVDEVCRYSGPFPYLDGMILRATQYCGQIDVQHEARQAGRSGYTLAKLVGLWMNMSVGFSVLPLRFAAVLGAVGSLAGLVTFLFSILFGLGSTAMLCGVVVLAAGVQLVALGMIGEYLGRVLLHQSGMPQYVLRYVRRANSGAQAFRARIG